MRRILLSLIILLVACSVIGGAVYAVFNDTETSSNNQFSAGTLDLEVDDENPWASTPINVTSMKPGDSGSVSIKLYNSGTLPGSSLTIDLQGLNDDAGTTPEPEPTPDNGELSANIDIVIFEDNGAGGGTANNGVQDGTEATIYSGKLNTEAGPYAVGSGLGAGANTYTGISYSIASGVGNDIQDDSCTFNIVFVLTQ